MTALMYLRVLVAGVAARAWRVLRGRPCPCHSCSTHRAFVRDTEGAYQAEVRGELITDDDGDVYRTGDEVATLDGSMFRVPTVDEARHRRYR